MFTFLGDPRMIMTQEQAILKAQEKFEQITMSIRQASTEGQRIDYVESALWDNMLQLGRLMLEGYVAGYQQGDLGPTLEHKGRLVRRLDQPHVRRYVSVFGAFEISRYVYGTRETQKHELIPLDAILALPESDFSYILQDWDQSFCVENSYGESRRKIERILRIEQSVLSLEHINGHMASAVDSFRDIQPSPAAKEEGSILVLTADGKGVPMRREPGCSKAVRLKKGQKANKKRQACVGGVYTIEPFVRSVDDVINEFMREERQKQRPEPRNKQLRAELTRPLDGQEVNGKDRIFSWFAEQIKSRSNDTRKPIVCVMDGDRALREKAKQLMATLGITIICVLDLYHVLERLWSAAYCFHPEGSDEAQRFVCERLKRLLEGKSGYVIGGLRQMATKQKLSKSKYRQLMKVIVYLENNRSYMRYDQYLSQGYPIGSGVVEGACRHLVKDRMEGTGMRWRIPGAQAMLALRSVYLNDDWEAFQQYHIQTNTNKLYPYRQSVQARYRKTG